MEKKWLEGKVAVVTGSGRGIGKEIALLMAKNGAKVIVNDVDEDVANETAEEIKKGGGAVATCIATVSTMDGARRIIGTATENFGTLDVLVNNAGIIRDRMFWNMSEEEWDAVITTHLRGHFCCTKVAVDIMREKKSGRIINITSAAGLRGNQGQTNYSAAKAGVIGFTLTLAMELKRFDITVNAISPGAKTRMTLSVPEEVIRRKAKEDPRYLALLNLPGPEYVAPVAVYLASDEAKDITGKIIGIVGGTLSLWMPPQQTRFAYVDGMWTPELIHQRIKESLGGGL